MLPTVGSDTLKMVAYTAEVAGRTLGVAAMENLVPDATRRAALEGSGKKILTAAQTAMSAYGARILFQFVDSRAAIGKGRGVDKGFDAAIAQSSETIRTSLPDRSTSNPDYREIFPNGTEEYTSPTVKEDEALAGELRQAVEGSKLAVKAEVLADIDALIPIVGPIAAAVRDGEKKVSSLFNAELAERKNVVDTLWEERKNIENALGRGGRGLARFIFFDFRKPSEQGDEAPAPAGPAGSKEPEPT